MSLIRQPFTRVWDSEFTTLLDKTNFPGLVFDNAVCEVSIDRNRKVTAKYSEMEYD
jgi:hypothetical protein